MCRKIICLFVFFSGISLYSQYFSVYNINTANYPEISANLIAIDGSGKYISNLTPADISLLENSIKRDIISIDCPTSPSVDTFSIALSIDISGSMSTSPSGSGAIPVELGKSTARALVNSFELPPNQFAIQTCNSVALINLDFSSDKNLLLNTIDPIFAGGDNDFVEHLLNPTTGLLNIAKKGKYRRVAIIYTDAYWYKLSSSQLQAALDTCQKYNITFFAVIYSRKDVEPDGIKSSLNTLAKSTGGIMLDGILEDAAAKSISGFLKSMMENSTPCTIKWNTSGCETTKLCDFSIPSHSLATNGTYYITFDNMLNLKINPKSLSFGTVNPPNTSSSTISITAINKDVEIESITPSDNHFSITGWGGTTPPFTLHQNENRILTVSFKPDDTTYYYSSFEVDYDTCRKTSFYASGGIFSNSQNPSLKLTFPNGGETFLVGADSIITWEGVLPTDTVSLQYSTDNGSSWNFITDTANSLKYYWHVPNTPSNECLMKVSQLGSGSDKESSFLAIDAYNSKIYDESWSPTSDLIVVCADIDRDSSKSTCPPKIFNSQTGNLVRQLILPSGAYGYVYSIDWSPDGSKIAGRCSDGNIYIWNASTGNCLKTFSPYYNSSYKLKLQWTPDSKCIVADKDCQYVDMIDISTGNIKYVLNYNGKYSTFYHPYISPDGNRVLAEGYIGSQSYNVIWDNTTNTEFLSVKNNDENAVIGPMAWSPDGNSFATYYYVSNSLSSTYSLRIIDAYDGSLKQERMFSDYPEYTNKIAWNPNGEFIAYTDYTSPFPTIEEYLTILNVNTNNIVNSLKITFSQSTGSYSASSLEWSPDGNKIAVGSQDGVLRIWRLGSQTIQEDVSDSLWAIVTPQAEAKDIDMGNVLLGRDKDSLVSKFIFNTGSYPVQIDSIFFTGNNPGDFSLVGGFPQYKIEVGANYFAEFLFTPKAVGSRNAFINIITQSDTLQYRIYGVGIQNALSLKSKLIDFGLVWVNKQKDTLHLAITNTSNAPFNFTSTKLIGPDNEQFLLLSDGGAFTLQANESRTIEARFAPIRAGRTSSQIAFYYNGTGSPEIINLYGIGLVPTISLRLPDVTSTPGTTILYPVYAKLDNEEISSIDNISLSGEIAFYADAFYPNESFSFKTNSDGISTANVPFSLNNISISNTETMIKEIKGLVLLSDLEKTPVTATNLITSPSEIEVTKIDGSITIQVCAFPLMHLVIFQPLALSIEPNPISSNSKIKILTESESIDLYIYSIEGTLIEKFHFDKKSKESIELIKDFSNYNTGIYTILVKTSEERVVNKLIIAK